jgi:hypothetical protein
MFFLILTEIIDKINDIIRKISGKKYNISNKTQGLQSEAGLSLTDDKKAEIIAESKNKPVDTIFNFVYFSI